MSRNRDFREPRRRGFDDDFAPRGRGGFGGPRDFPDPRGMASPIARTGPTVDATVKWFNPEKGFGFVELADGTGDAFLHIRALEAAGHDAVAPGTKLNVRTGQGQKGPQVTEIITLDASTATEPVGGGRGPGGPGGGGGFERRSPSGPRPFNRQPTGPAEDHTGTVKWYNPEKGFGFIQVEDGGKDVFVHRSALQRAGLQELYEGQRVAIQVVEGAKGRETMSIALAD